MRRPTRGGDGHAIVFVHLIDTACRIDAKFVPENVKMLNFDEKLRKFWPCTMKGCAPCRTETIHCQTEKEGVLAHS